MLGIIGAINEVLLDGDTQNEKYAGPIEYVTIPISINGVYEMCFTLISNIHYIQISLAINSGIQLHTINW